MNPFLSPLNQRGAHRAEDPPTPIRSVVERLRDLATDAACDPLRDPWHPELILVNDTEAAEELARLLPHLTPAQREHRFLAMVDWADQIDQGDEDGPGPDRDMWLAGMDGMAAEVEAALLADILATGGAA